MARKYDPTIWMPLYIGDTLGETLHLSTEEFGALIYIKMHYWRNEGAFRADNISLSSITKLSIERLEEIKPKLLDFFTDIGGKWQSEELDQLYTEALEQKAKASARGKSGAKARWGKNKRNEDGGTDAIEGGS